MPRFLFASLPVYGHLSPAIEIARALLSREHEVAIYTGSTVAPLVNGEGLRHFPFVRVDEARFIGHVYDRNRSFRITQPLGLVRFLNTLLLDFADPQIQDIACIYDSWHPDLIVCDVMMWGPLLVMREAFGARIAVLCTAAGCTVPGPEAPLWGTGLPPPRTALTRLRAGLFRRATGFLAGNMRRRANDIRRAYGLPPVPSSVAEFLGTAERYLVCSVPELDYRRQDLPPSVRYIGPMTGYRPHTGCACPWIDKPDDRPLIHVTEGTMQGRPELISAAVRGLASLNVRVLITTGRNRDPADLGVGPLPENIRIEQFVPHNRLLPKTALVITQGGAGTVLSALAYGVPLLVVPAESDQYDNATRVVEAGVGLSIPRRACSPRLLRRTVERMLHQPNWREQAQRFPQIFAEYGGASRAVAVVEELASNRG